MNEINAASMAGVGMIGVCLIIGILVKKTDQWFRGTKEMRQIRRLFRRDSKFPRNAYERQLLMVLIKKAALKKGGWRKSAPQSRYVAVKYICLGLIPVLSSLHHFLIQILNQSHRKSTQILIKMGEEILYEISKKR
jgi:hypothetical protein